MPSLPVALEESIPSLDSLAPRDAEAASLGPRSPDVGAAAADNPYTRNALNALAERSNLENRDIVLGIIPSYYTTGGPAAGTVAGIVLGSVVGFLMLIWLFYSLANIGNPAVFGRANIAGEEEIVVRRRRNSHSGHSRRSTRTEVREHSRSPRRRDTVIVEERRHPRTTRARSIVVEERTRRVPGDDVVEVFEEDDYSSRRGSRR